MIHNLEHSEERTQEIDVKFVRTRKIDYLDTFMKLDRQYKIEKSSQYPIHRQLQELQNKVVEQEEETISCENKCRLLGNHLVKINEEIECIQRENNDLIKENEALKHRLVDIKEVPSITNYAYVMERTKDLQHQIDVWTRRVTIAEVSSTSMYGLSIVIFMYVCMLFYRRYCHRQREKVNHRMFCHLFGNRTAFANNNRFYLLINVSYFNNST